MPTTPDPPRAGSAPALARPPPARLRELLARYDRPGPRYTSYPTAADFGPGVGEATARAVLARAAAHPDAPWSLYVHLPFCAHRCLYCACSVVITRDPALGARYLEGLTAELALLAPLLGGRRRVTQLHLGGGTPTWYAAADLDVLLRRVRAAFDLDPAGERAVELDPRVTTRDQLEVLAAHGFARASLGVQDLDPEVQAAVGRVQPLDAVRRIAEEARALGYASLNVDLIYGLPRQTPAGWRRTLEAVLGLRPERAAVYGFAHVPWLKAHQRRLRAEDLPGPAARLELLALAIEAFTAAGYVHVGLDHFARPEDTLARALMDGTLGRNFMGYAPRVAPDTLGVGMSAISDVNGVMWQGQRKLAGYGAALAEGRLPVERGHARGADDELRRTVIHALMVGGRVDKAAVAARHGVDFDRHFAAELARLAEPEADGLVERRREALVVTPLGRLFVRNVAMAFDARLAAPVDAPGPPRYSRTV